MSTDFGEILRPRARHAHRCEWCGEGIAVGVRHVQYCGLWGGEWQSWRMHDECYANARETDALQDGFIPYEAERPVARALEGR